MATHQFGIGRVADHLDNVVVGDRQTDGVLQIALEGQVDVAAVQHQRAVDATRSRERQHQATRPMRQRAGFGGEAPDAADACAAEIDAQVGARCRADMHAARRLEPAHRIAHLALVFGAAAGSARESRGARC